MSEGWVTLYLVLGIFMLIFLMTTISITLQFDSLIELVDCNIVKQYVDEWNMRYQYYYERCT